MQAEIAQEVLGLLTDLLKHETWGLILQVRACVPFMAFGLLVCFILFRLLYIVQRVPSMPL